MGRKRNEQAVKKGPGRKARKQPPPDFTRVFNKKIGGFVKTIKGKRNVKASEKEERGDEEINDFEPFEVTGDKEQPQVASGDDYGDEEEDGGSEQMEFDDEESVDEKVIEPTKPSAKGKTAKTNGNLLLNIVQNDSKKPSKKEEAGKQLKARGETSNGTNGKKTKVTFAAAPTVSTLPPNENAPAESDDDLNDEDEEEEEGGHSTGAGQVMNLKALQARIKKVSTILSDFANRREAERTRRSYTDELCNSLATYYGYNAFLIRKFYDLFPNDIVDFLEANERERPLTIRTNTLKTKRRELMAALQQRGVQVESIGEWSKVGLVVYDSHVPIGATPEYLAGHYVLQGASSWLPVMALAPQLGERVLDLCSAPGGKTSHIAALLRNGGLLLANDANKDRLKAVVGNLHRLGVNNSIISARDGCTMGHSMPNAFDRVLLDAPCSGTGVIAKDASVKANKTETDVRRCSSLQKRLILSAIDACNARSSTGGYIVYSTCSVFIEENEAVIQYALRKRFVKIVDSGVDFGHEGFTKFQQHRFNQRMRLARRVYPHTHNMDGFFFCKLQKVADGIRVDPEVETKAKAKRAEQKEEKDESDKETEKTEKKPKKAVGKAKAKNSERNGEKRKPHSGKKLKKQIKSLTKAKARKPRTPK